MPPASRFLVDENLSITLPPLAHARGFEAQHVNELGLAGARDWTLMEIIEADGWTLVTNNVREFEERFQTAEIHPGILLIVPNVTIDLQQKLFALALDEAERIGDLTNRAIRIEIVSKAVEVTSYELPRV